MSTSFRINYFLYPCCRLRFGPKSYKAEAPIDVLGTETNLHRYLLAPKSATLSTIMSPRKATSKSFVPFNPLLRQAHCNPLVVQVGCQGPTHADQPSQVRYLPFV
jgi:hypothetical protein